MAKILKQQESLCALFSAATLFVPEIETNQLQAIIDKYSIKVKQGMTLAQENQVIYDWTRGTLQLEPLYVNIERTVQLWKFKRFLLIKKGIDYQEARRHLLALSVKLFDGMGESLHRIWVINSDNKKFEVIDTRFEETISFTSIKEIYNQYDIVAVFCTHSMEYAENVYFSDDAFQHLL